MKITDQLKQEHDELLEKLHKQFFYGEFATKNPTTYVKYSRCLGDIYAYFMRYDTLEEPITENNNSFHINRSVNSEDGLYFEKELVPELKKIKQNNPDLFYSGMTLIESGCIPSDITATTLSSFAWFFGDRAQRLMKVRHRENTYIIYNKNIQRDQETITIFCSKHQKLEMDAQSTCYLFEQKAPYCEFLGRYHFVSAESISDSEYKIILSPTLVAIDNIIPDFKELDSHKVSQNSEVYYRDPNKKALVLARAKGLCENSECINKAPFLNEKKEVFLESHHIISLSEQGKDTLDNMIALCPNCHREAHYGQNKDHLKKLFLDKFSN